MRLLLLLCVLSALTRGRAEYSNEEDGGDLHYTQWSEWSECSVTCGVGRRVSYRCYYSNYYKWYFSQCNQFTENKQVNWEACTMEACPVNGVWGSWGTWGRCSQSCGSGSKVRFRACDNPEPANGGTQCFGPQSQLTYCKAPACPVNGHWGHWGSWSECSKSCGKGSKGRSRVCDNPAPANGGNTCPGSAEESAFCNTDACPVNGGWGSWGDWGHCTKSCDGGSQVRTRVCDNPSPAPGGASCSGPETQSKICNTHRCAVNGAWGAWGAWGKCSKTCGLGSRVRTRECDNPAPINGGLPCAGDGSDSAECHTRPCPVDGQWSPWLQWSMCSQSCGGGSQVRTRVCDNPSPSDGGATCAGDANQSQSCNILGCPVDGSWGVWGEWSECTKPCDGGVQMRSRPCDNPKPANGGAPCPGSVEQSHTCNTHPCPVDGKWGPWTVWGACSATCGEGSTVRTRVCDNPRPSNGGENCQGSPKQTNPCNVTQCPVVNQWGSWGAWGRCSQSCGKGSKVRSRDCEGPASVASGGMDACQGESQDTTECNTHECPVWGKWTAWAQCSKTCGTGERLRTRPCYAAPSFIGYNACHGPPTQREDCNQQTCPVDGSWAEWTTWTPCTHSCGGGTKTRTRTCTNPSPSDGGAPCPGCDQVMDTCNQQDCVTQATAVKTCENIGQCALATEWCMDNRCLCQPHLFLSPENNHTCIETCDNPLPVYTVYPDSVSLDNILDTLNWESSSDGIRVCRERCDEDTNCVAITNLPEESKCTLHGPGYILMWQEKAGATFHHKHCQ